LLHQQQPQQARHHRQGQCQDRRSEVPEGGPRRRSSRQCARPHPRRQRRLLVRRQPGPPRARQARGQDREDQRLPDPVQHVAARRRRDARCRRQGQDLGIGSGWRRALRSGHRAVHRLQVDQALQFAEGYRHDLRGRRRSRRQRLVGPDGARHHRQGRYRHRQGDRSGTAVDKEQMDRVTPKAREFYESYNELSFNTPLPWSQGPRRMGTAKNADVLWVGNSWGASLARIDTKTGQTSIIPFPESTYQPYHIAVDQHHNVWGNLWTADRIAKYDPSKNEWTMFDLPTRGTEIRHISLLEKDGVTKVTVPIYRDSKMGVMTLRSEADIAAL